MVDTLHDGEIPTRPVLGTEARTGKYTRNPFNWVHVNIRKLTLSRDRQIVNPGQLKVNFSTGDVNGWFRELLLCKKIRYSNAGMRIDMDDYKNGGYALWAYDLSPSQCDKQFNNPISRGKQSLKVEFEN